MDDDSSQQVLTQSARQVRQRLLAERTTDGHWVGELSASALSTATAISALSFFLQHNEQSDDRQAIQRQIESGIAWLVELQNEDGGWGDTTSNYSNISTSMLVIAAFAASAAVLESGSGQPGDDVVDRARRYVESAGGVEGIRQRYGDDKTFAVPILANAAMAGLVPWSDVAALPFEAACVPQKFYHWLNLPVVSYAIPALVAIGQVKFKYDPPRNPLVRWIRRCSIERSLRLLQRMQPQSGGYLEAVPLTSFVCMALIHCGRAEHSVVRQGIEFLKNSFRQESPTRGTWPIDTNLATWVTTLSVNALCSDPDFRMDSDAESERQWKQCLQWLLDCQYQTVHPFTAALPGGFGWSDLSGAVPDADDTPGALLALKHFRERMTCDPETRRRIDLAGRQGVDWLVRLQNRDRGWPTFCRGWGRLPFDRSGSDITAHVIRALYAWNSDSEDRQRVERAIAGGFDYLAKNQLSNGSWLPLWFGNQDEVDDINPFYGTAKVLQAYYVTRQFDTKPARNGLEWIVQNQNADGGWGGGRSVNWNLPGLEHSSVEETALSTEVLLFDQRSQARAAAKRGLRWLALAVEHEVFDRSSPIGFYFAKLWYFEKLYPIIFAASTLGLACDRESANQESSGETIDTVHRER